MSFFDLVRGPDRLLAVGESDHFVLAPGASDGRHTWTHGDIRVLLVPTGADALAVRIQAPRTALTRIQLRWRIDVAAHLLFLGDHWERAYGDAAWRSLVPDRPLPWYVLIHDGEVTHGYGVEVQPRALCCWQIDDHGVSLWLDIACGGRGVVLQQRQLDACTIVTRRGIPGESASAAARTLARRLCPSPCLPAVPLYGSNDFYYAYCQSTADDLRRDAALISELAPDTGNRPYQVVDGGWSRHHRIGCEGGPWQGNAKFPDLPRLAEDIRARGCRPGLWFRPLLWEEPLPAHLLLPERRFAHETTGRRFDPTVPEALARIQADVRTFRAWGYELIKHDFSAYDIFGRWGFQMGFAVTDPGWHFADRSQTTAEAILGLYRALRTAAQDTPIIACNAVSHLTAGLAELNRIGDDTSGRVWERTRRMGINCLAFRSHQHGAFSAVDADCVGLTTKIPWEFNRQWLDLLSRSGTPLFVSVEPAAAGPAQRQALREAFTRAAQPQPLAEPLDWLRSTAPAHWRCGDETHVYDWYGEDGVRVLDAMG